MIKKIIPVAVALVLIAAVGVIGFGGRFLEKYRYSKERADLDGYFGTAQEGELAIVLQDEIIAEKAALLEGAVYFDMETVGRYLNEGFYVDRGEGLLLYTAADGTVETAVGSKEYSDREGAHSLEQAACLLQGERLYVSAEYVRRFANFSYELFDRHIQLDTQWGERQTMEVLRGTQVRLLGGIKSPILRDLQKGERVELLDEMETWSKVKTSDSIIGYVENKRLGNPASETDTPVADYVPAEYTSIALPGKVNLGFHSIGGEGGNSTLGKMLAEGEGINVIAPTWFSLTDGEGGFRSFASAKYVEEAHGRGIQVWGVWDNFNFGLETGEKVDVTALLSSTAKRRQLAGKMVETALELKLDGVNIDFEGLAQECGVHYVQFLKELSVLCREKGVILSVDSYVPFNFNNYYRLDIQGRIADYVVIMGYDEHWLSGGEAGSVASIGYVSGGLDRTIQEEQVPPEKVVNALPFYTILWRTEGAKVTGEYITLNNVEDFLKQEGAVPEWDEATCQNYAEWESGGARYQIWVEDEESLLVKLNVMRAKGIGGVAVWRLGYGTEQAWSLISAYAGS